MPTATRCMSRWRTRRVYRAAAAPKAIWSSTRIGGGRRPAGSRASGYGFLPRGRAYTRALEKASIVVIGPNPGAIAAMGDKIESKRPRRGNVSTAGPSRRDRGREARGEIASDWLPGEEKASAAAAASRRIAYRNPKWRRVRAIEVEAKSRSATTRCSSKKLSLNQSQSRAGARRQARQRLLSANANARSSAATRRSSEAPRRCSMRRKKKGRAAARSPRRGSTGGTVEFVAVQEGVLFRRGTRGCRSSTDTELVTGIDLVSR